MLRPYQQAAREAIEKEWSEGRKNTLLVLPTGTGKTVVFTSVVEDRVAAGDRCLILAHRGELLDQAADKLYKNTGLKCSIEKASDSCLDSFFRVTVGSVQTLMRQKRLDLFPRDYFNTIVIDEAHHSTSDSYTRILDHFDEAKVLGVTATPDRGDMQSLGKVFDSIAYEYTMPQAIREGYLCPIKAQTVPLDLDLTGVGVAAGDFKPGELGSALEPYLEQIASVMEDYCRDRKTVVFLPLVAISQKFRDILNAHGFSAAEVNGNSSDRAEVLRDFETGKYNVLCNSMLLTEGWDCPAVDCVIVLRPTKIRSLYCLDEQTEVLTREGWKKDVEIGEEVLAFNKDTGATMFVPTLAKVRRPLESDEFFCSIKGQSTDIRVTNHHRMIYDHKRRTGWKFKEAQDLAKLKDDAYLPVCGVTNHFPGVPLTDAELTFIGWVMTDGTINKSNNAITITQSSHQVEYCAEIEECIKGCGFKFGKRIRKRTKEGTNFNVNSDLVVWTISKGKPRGRDKHLTGWARLEPWLSKDLSPKLFDMTSRQFSVMLEAIYHGDGNKSWKSTYHIGKGNKTFIERLQIMGIQRGYRASVSVEKANKVRKSDLWYLHIKKTEFVKIGSMSEKHSTWTEEPHSEEMCWCVENELGTLVTRRNGKVVIVGNCQMVGRGTRIAPGKDHLLLLDFLWHTDRHQLCHPASLICTNDEVARQMTKNLETEQLALDIIDAEKDAESDVMRQREEALAAQLAQMRKRKAKLVDPLQYEMSIYSEDLANYVPAFGYEMKPASESQLRTIEKFGINPDGIECAGKASLILDKLIKRKNEGLATPKQIRFLEGKGFKRVGTWTFEEASKMIGRISANGWRVPHGVYAPTYQPERVMYG